MNAPSVVVDATLQPDGLTLRLEKKLGLPPGPVTVLVQSLPTRTGSTMLETLDRIHREQQERGRKPVTEAEMADEIARTRAEDDDDETRWREVWSHTVTKAPSTDIP